MSSPCVRPSPPPARPPRSGGQTGAAGGVRWRSACKGDAVGSTWPDPMVSEGESGCKRPAQQRLAVSLDRLALAPAPGSIGPLGRAEPRGDGVRPNDGGILGADAPTAEAAAARELGGAHWSTAMRSQPEASA